MPVPDCSYVDADDVSEPTGSSYSFCVQAEIRALKVKLGNIIATDASGVYVPAGTGSIVGTTQDALRHFVHTAQYLTVGDFDAALAALTGTFGVNDLEVSGSSELNGNVTITGNQVNVGNFTLTGAFTHSEDLGVAAPGATTHVGFTTTFSGDAGGTTLVYAEQHFITADGANNINNSRVMYIGNNIETTAGATAAAYAQHNYIWLKDAGTVTNARVIEGHLRVDGTGGITSTANVFNVASITLTGTGVVNQATGFNCGNLGHATLVNRAIGFNCGDLTGSAILTAGFKSELTAGSNKWNLYITGDADNFIEGKIRWGATAIEPNNGKVVSITNVGPGAGAGVSIQEWLEVVNATGSTRYIPLFG